MRLAISPTWLPVTSTQAAGGVGAVAQARHDRLAVKLLQSAVGRDVGDQQPGRVRSDIDDGNAHAKRG